MIEMITLYLVTKSTIMRMNKFKEKTKWFWINIVIWNDKCVDAPIKLQCFMNTRWNQNCFCKSTVQIFSVHKKVNFSFFTTLKFFPAHSPILRRMAWIWTLCPSRHWYVRIVHFDPNRSDMRFAIRDCVTNKLRQISSYENRCGL
jgi:hypothetical protein